MARIRALLGRARLAHDGLRIRWQKPGAILVEFESSGRRQAIRYREEGEEFELVSPVLPPRDVVELGRVEVAHEALERNRSTLLVGFRLNGSDGLEAWVRQRSKTMHRADLLFCVGQLAREADRFQELLTGVDS